VPRPDLLRAADLRMGERLTSERSLDGGDDPAWSHRLGMVDGAPGYLGRVGLMVDHETLLHRTKQARAAFEEAQADAEAAKQDYHERVRELAAAGMSLREIGVELGLSHQRVHQIVSEARTSSRRRRIATAAAAGTGTVLAALVLATAWAGVPTPWSPVEGSGGSQALARLYPVGLERFVTPEQAAAAAATDAYTQLEGVDTEVVLRFPGDVALDARVRVTGPDFCRIYSASGKRLDGAIAWSAFGEGLSCSPSNAS